jgi:hypothetical protein
VRQRADRYAHLSGLQGEIAMIAGRSDRCGTAPENGPQWAQNDGPMRGRIGGAKIAKIASYRSVFAAGAG